MRHSLMLLGAAMLLALTGCGAAESSLPQEMSAVLSENSAPVTGEHPTASPDGTTTARTTTTVTTVTTTAPAEVTEPLAAAQSTITERNPGGEGGEAQAEHPAPLNFTFRFTQTAIGVRLAGGLYQTLPCDLTKLKTDLPDLLYTLEDLNFDGNADLLMPIDNSTANIKYAVYLWDPAANYFIKTPLEIVNPVAHPDTNEITSLTRESAEAWMLYSCRIENGVLTSSKKAAADYTTLTVTVDPDGKAKRTQYASASEMETAFLALHKAS